MQQETDQKVHKVPLESTAFAPNTTESNQDKEEKKRSFILLYRVSFVIFQLIRHTTHPLKGENPAASSYAQQNVEGPSVASGHHMSCALADLVNYWKTTQCFHELANDVLLPMKGGGQISKQPMQKKKKD